MNTVNSKTRNLEDFITRTLYLAAIVLAMSGCVYDPYPPPPPPGPIVAAPGSYYAQPCCYAYPEYPAYYGYGPSAAVNLSFGRGGWGGHHHWH